MEPKERKIALFEKRAEVTITTADPRTCLQEFLPNKYNITVYYSFEKWGKTRRQDPKFDLVVIDPCPDVFGPKSLQEIRQVDPTVPILATCTRRTSPVELDNNTWYVNLRNGPRVMAEVIQQILEPKTPSFWTRLMSIFARR